MSDGKRKNIAWTVDQDGAVTFDREDLIAVKPSARCGRVTAYWMVDVRANRFDRGYAFQKLRSGAFIIGAHDKAGAKTVSEGQLGVFGKHPIDVT